MRPHSFRIPSPSVSFLLTSLLLGVFALPAPASTGTVVSVLATDPEAAERSFADPAVPDPGEIVVMRTGPLDQGLLVSLSISGTASNGYDYKGLPTLSLVPGFRNFAHVTIPAGASSAAIPIDPIPDSESEGGETVTLTLDPRFDYSVDQDSSATVIISERQRDPDAPPVSALEIPTLGTWGMMLLALLLLGAGAGLMTRG